MVRALTLKDEPEVIEVFLKLKESEPLFTGFGSWSESKFRAELESGHGLIEEKGIVRGFILYRTIPDGYEITLLGTHPDYQKQGIMHAILSVLLRKVKPGEHIWLEVHENNAPARHLYENAGFKTMGQRPYYYSDGAAALNLEYKT